MLSELGALDQNTARTLLDAIQLQKVSETQHCSFFGFTVCGFKFDSTEHFTMHVIHQQKQCLIHQRHHSLS